jgi:hypothetical protein
MNLTHVIHIRWPRILVAASALHVFVVAGFVLAIATGVGLRGLIALGVAIVASLAWAAWLWRALADSVTRTLAP